MESGRTILRSLRRLDDYLKQFRLEQSIYFERLTALAISRLLYLPLYTTDSDDGTVEHRVVWKGSERSGVLSRAPQGKADIIAYCYGFRLVVEATQKTGSGQWAGEFAQALRHAEDFVAENSVGQTDTYVVLVAPRLHRDTYCSLRHHPPQDYKFVPLAAETLAGILETSILAFTMKHLELRGMLNKIPEWLACSTSLSDFETVLKREVEAWQVEVLKREKNAFIGVKSYEAMQRIPRPAVSVSEILKSLLRHPFVGQYMRIAGGDLSPHEIEKILLDQSLGCRAGRTIQTDEPLFECVPCMDFKGRALRLVNAVEQIG